MRTIFEEYGAAVIALIVAAILMVALGVYNVTNGEGTGISKTAGESTSKTVDSYKKRFFDTKDNRGGIGDTKTYVSKTESQVGKYADVDGDGTVDGIIFADLMIGGSGIWNSDTTEPTRNELGTFEIPTISSCKDYYVSQEGYTNNLGGTSDVLTPTGEGNARFYVMALNDVDSNLHNWYYEASWHPMDDYKTATSQEFGEGKKNTETMINKWINKEYGNQNSGTNTDIWGEIQEQTDNGWFIPSCKEWDAFAKNIEIGRYNYTIKGLKWGYWSSCQYNTMNAYRADFSSGYLGYFGVNGTGYLRLATIF